MPQSPAQPSHALPLVPLGSSGLTVSRVGFGAWAAGGGGWAFGWGPQDDHESIAAMRHAVEAGVNWIDTAAVYGLGHSERVVARAIEPFAASDRPYIFTKGGLVWDEHDRTAPPRRIGAPESLRRELDASLERLGVEQVDLYQMHWPPEDGTPLEDYWGTLLDLKAEGKARAVGLSNHDADALAAAERVGHVDTLQPPFSALRRDAAAREVPWCLAHTTGVIVYSPMQAGLLSGSFSRDRLDRLPQDDWRRRSREFAPDVLDRHLAIADALRPIAAARNTTVASVAVAWTLACPGVTGAIVGARRPLQVDGWLAAAHMALRSDELEVIARAIDTHQAGSGPVRPATESR